MLKPTRPRVELVDSSEASLADLQELRLEFVHSTLRTRNSSSSSLNIPETLRFPQLVTLALALYQYLSGLYYRSPSLDLSRCLMFNLKFMHYTSVFSAPSAVYISSFSNLRDNDLSSLLGYRFPFVRLPYCLQLNFGAPHGTFFSRWCGTQLFSRYVRRYLQVAQPYRRCKANPTISSC
jgi:hypothetical protein